jgi:hypothetical protein
MIERMEARRLEGPWSGVERMLELRLVVVVVVVVVVMVLIDSKNVTPGGDT